MALGGAKDGTDVFVSARLFRYQVPARRRLLLADGPLLGDRQVRPVGRSCLRHPAVARETSHRDDRHDAHHRQHRALGFGSSEARVRAGLLQPARGRRAVLLQLVCADCDRRRCQSRLNRVQGGLDSDRRHGVLRHRGTRRTRGAVLHPLLTLSAGSRSSPRGGLSHPGFFYLQIILTFSSL